MEVKQDEECIDQADEQLLDILGHIVIHGYDTVEDDLGHFGVIVLLVLAKALKHIIVTRIRTD